MAENPQAGWYSDPENSERLRYWDGRAWTGQIRDVERPGGIEVSRRRLSPLAVVGIVVVALTVIGGGVAFFLTGGDPDPTAAQSPNPTSHTPTPDATRTAPPVIAPEGWEVYVSRSGAFEYAYRPEWTDALTPGYEQMLLGEAQLENFEMEVAGSWILDGSLVTGETNLIFLATSDGTTVPGLMEIQAQSFVRSNVAGLGSDDYEEILSEGITTANGYDAWRIDYTMMAFDSPFTASVVAFRHETTLGFIYVASLKEYEEWLPDFLQLVDSLVVVKPPESP